MSKTTGSSIKPLFDYVLVRPIEGESKTPSGIVLPDSVEKKSQMGEVMAIGPGSDCCGGDCCEDDKKCSCSGMVVKVGQKVIYKKWGGNEVKMGNEEWTIVEQKDILAIVK